MSCHPLLVFDWCCDGCCCHVWTPDRDPPSKWTDQYIQLGPYSKRFQLCPTCSVDPQPIIDRWQSRFSSVKLKENQGTASPTVPLDSSLSA